MVLFYGSSRISQLAVSMIYALCNSWPQSSFLQHLVKLPYLHSSRPAQLLRIFTCGTWNVHNVDVLHLLEKRWVKSDETSSLIIDLCRGRVGSRETTRYIIPRLDANKSRCLISISILIPLLGLSYHGASWRQTTRTYDCLLKCTIALETG